MVRVSLSVLRVLSEITSNYIRGVTLGAKSFPLDADGKPIKGIPRHPIPEDNVIVYSNATILGRITIGRDATVGGNIWVTENVPAGARIVQTKAKKIKSKRIYMSEQFEMIAKTFQGLEEILAEELTALGANDIPDRTPHGFIYRR